jgi:hypothetical protein
LVCPTFTLAAVLAPTTATVIAATTATVIATPTDEYDYRAYKAPRLGTINNDIVSCDRLADCKIDWVHRIRRCRSRLPYIAE